MVTLLQDLAPDALDPLRGEDIWAIVGCYRESKVELEHCFKCLTQPDGLSMRAMVFVDGVQDTALFSQTSLHGGFMLTASSIIAVREASMLGLPPPEPWNDESLSTLFHLAGILPLTVPVIVHGCLRFTGVSQQGVPFEVYVKGPKVLRTKRASHALCFSLLMGEDRARRPLPSALLMVDGDAGGDPGTIGKMFSCLVSQDLGGVSPVLLPKCVESTVQVWQTVRNWGISGAAWTSQSLFGFQHPACGAYVMFSREAVTSVMEDFCRLGSGTSLWDSWVEIGEDAHFTILLLEKGFKICHMLHCRATVFMPDTWLEYLSQQCRWKQSQGGNYADLLFRRKRAWAGPQAMLWPVEFVELLLRGQFLGVGLAVFLFANITGSPLRDMMEGTFPSEPSDRTAELLVLALFWAFLVPYIMLAVGRPVKDLPHLHYIAMSLAVTVPLLQFAITLVYWHAYLHWAFWLLIFISFALNSLSKLPHGLWKPWAGVVLPVMTVLVSGVENVLGPITAVANADAGSMLGWGTRQGARERAALAKMGDQDLREKRRTARDAALACWLFANFCVGALPFALGIDSIVLKFMLGFAAANLTLNMTFGCCYSCWLCWALSNESEQRERASVSKSLHRSMVKALDFNTSAEDGSGRLLMRNGRPNENLLAA